MANASPARDPEMIDHLSRALGCSTPAREVRERLADYVALVARWNRRVNLTGATEPRALHEVLLADAFILADAAIVPPGTRLIDVGAGAGAPSVPLLLLRPDVHVLCVEPRAKRAAFLRTASATLGLLERARVREARLEPERPLPLDAPFDVAASRATFDPERWLALGIRLAPQVLVFTPGAAPARVPDSARHLLMRRYELPWSRSSRAVHVYLRE